MAQFRFMDLDIWKANISFVAYRRKFIDKGHLDQILNDLELLSRRITSFRKSILTEKL